MYYVAFLPMFVAIVVYKEQPLKTNVSAMNNKDLFINGFLESISKEYPQSQDSGQNKNLAFEILAIGTVLDRSFQEVFDKILIKDKSGKMSGSQDGGIDGIWFQDIGSYYEMHVFQCKNTQSLKANELDKFRNDVKDIFNDGNKVGKTNIDDLKSYIDEYKNISQNGKIIETKLYFVYNGINNDPTHNNNQILFNTYSNDDFKIIDSDWIYSKLYSFIKTRRNEVSFTFHPINSNFSPKDNQALYTFSILNIRAANFRIEAIELCQLIDEEIKNNGSFDTLFEENIRQFLGLKFRANKKMRETLEGEDSVLFPFLNNGITIVCQEMTTPKSPQDGKYNLPVINPQIVNGLQTSRVLYHFYQNDKSKLDGVYVNLRVYESKEKSLIDKITDATNTQTPISFRDKVSNKDFNEFTHAVFKNNGIEYITKRGESFNKETSFTKQVESDTIAKFWYATFYEEPETAKNSIARVLQVIFEASTDDKHQLSELFNGNQDSPLYGQFLVVYYIYKLVQDRKKITKEGTTHTYLEIYEHLKYSDELMSYGIYKKVGANLKNYKDSDLSAAYDFVAEHISIIVDEEKNEHEKSGSTFSFNGYFKKSKCRYDYNKKVGIIEDVNLIEKLKHLKVD